MDELKIKTETDVSETSDQPGSVSEEISQQDQNAQLFIEALLQASQNQLLTESAVLAMNQLWMGNRGVVPSSGQGNISLGRSGTVTVAGTGNISLVAPGNITLASPGNISLAGSRNITLAGTENIPVAKAENVSSGSGNVSVVGAQTVALTRAGDIGLSDLKTESLRTMENVSIGHMNIVRPADASQFANQVILQGSSIVSSQNSSQIQGLTSLSAKDSQLKQALAAPVGEVSQLSKVCTTSGNKVTDVQSVSVGSETAVLSSHHGDTIVSDFSNPSQSCLSSVVLDGTSNTAIFSAEIVPELMDTSEATGISEQTLPDSVVTSSADLSLRHSGKKSASLSSSTSPKKKSRRQSNANDGPLNTSSCSTKSQPAQEKSGTEITNRTTTPRRRGSHLSDGGRRSRPLSECDGDLTPDTPSLISTFSSDDLRRQMTGSVTPETDLSFQPSMLDAVLTEKKLALLRSPEVRQFLHQQQLQRAKERKLTHSSRGSCSKGDNSL